MSHAKAARRYSEAEDCDTGNADKRIATRSSILILNTSSCRSIRLSTRLKMDPACGSLIHGRSSRRSDFTKCLGNGGTKNHVCHPHGWESCQARPGSALSRYQRFEEHQLFLENRKMLQYAMQFARDGSASPIALAMWVNDLTLDYTTAAATPYVLLDKGLKGIIRIGFP